MNPLLAAQAYCGDLARGTAQAWNRFWFTPADPATLSAIRILAGAMLLYTHAVWSIDLVEFFGPQSWVNPQAMPAYYNAQDMSQTWAWSHFWWIESPGALWAAHLAALVIFA